MAGFSDVALQKFSENFHMLAQQKTSRLMNTRALKFVPIDGKEYNYARMSKLTMSEVETRNPDKQYADYGVDNRQFTTRRFTRTITIDAKHDINELITDPQNALIQQLAAAQQRVVDQIAISAAVGSVLIGASNTTPTALTAANDGVITIDETSGAFDYDTLIQLEQNFINNELGEDEIDGAVACVTGYENGTLLSDNKIISRDYQTKNPAETFMLPMVGRFGLVKFAGSRNGGLQVTNPVLPETSTTRKNVILAPDSILMRAEITAPTVERNPSKVDSFDITANLIVAAMRTEGARVQIVTTTMN